jgi:hypothetical protein
VTAPSGDQSDCDSPPAKISIPICDLEEYETIGNIFVNTETEVIKVKHKETGKIYTSRTFIFGDPVKGQVRNQLEMWTRDAHMAHLLGSPFAAVVYCMKQIAEPDAEGKRRHTAIVEYMDGKDLPTYLYRNVKPEEHGVPKGEKPMFHVETFDTGVSEEQARSLTAQVAAGIYDMQSRGVINLDLIIVNFLMAENFTKIKVGDFAIGCLQTDGYRLPGGVTCNYHTMWRQFADMCAKLMGVDINPYYLYRRNGLRDWFPNRIPLIQGSYKYPKSFPPALADLVHHLFKRTAEIDSGNCLEGEETFILRDIQKVMNHEWFSGVNWTELTIPTKLVQREKLENVWSTGTGLCSGQMRKCSLDGGPNSARCVSDLRLCSDANLCAKPKEGPTVPKANSAKEGVQTESIGTQTGGEGSSPEALQDNSRESNAPAPPDAIAKKQFSTASPARIVGLLSLGVASCVGSGVFMAAA